MIVQVLLAIVALLITRTLYLLIRIQYELQNLNHLSKQKKSLKTLIILGSGGHSTEMLRLVKSLNNQIFTPQIYVVASSDGKSKQKLFENESRNEEKMSKYVIHEIPRSRHVHQSYVTSVFTTLYSILYCIPFMLKTKPDLIICNGPGTCVPICLMGFLLRILYLSNCYIVFVESICRVQSLSLSGLCLYYFVDIFLVQWPDLLEKYKRAKYIGKF